jgi:hypothetical protein
VIEKAADLAGLDHRQELLALDDPEVVEEAVALGLETRLERLPR